MPESPAVQNQVIDAIVRHAGRSTLPFQEAHTDRGHGTAFWFNDLVDATPGQEAVHQYLLTASAVTGYELGEMTLRAELCQPAMSAEKLLMRDFADGWIDLAGIGVAVMPTAGLHVHGERKGWRWSTDEITDGLAAREADLAAIGTEPVPAYILGHDVGAERGERLQAVVVGNAVRSADGTMHWDGAVPLGCVGAPVFVSVPLGDQKFKLVCAGLVLPGDTSNPIATFDRIRAAVRALSSPPEPKRSRWGWRSRRSAGPGTF
ncbi:hypothetical protein [Peterkaempfera griseoplana]|uniref:hypothetical protein n=1 Tax=Peterkaempfera griseoplana TaxID=66896 RepID=UPI0006E18DE5|nr:hypothetical protein [Peterkaempfera griseoplana]